MLPCRHRHQPRVCSTANPAQKLEKVVPDQPKTSTPVHLRTRQVLADFPVLSTQKPFVAPKADSNEGQS